MKRFLLSVLLMCLLGDAWAQVSLTNGSPSFTIDFSNTTPITAGSNPSSAFAGAGFEPDPTTAGRLNSNAWAATGWSNGNLSFGGTQTTVNTDYTRGVTTVAIATGGFYAYTGLPGSAADPTFMIQPGGSDWAPGTLTLRIQNNGTDNISQLAVSYNMFIRNDQDRSNSFNFSYSTDNVTFSPIGALDYSSPEVLDGLGWVLVGTAPSRSTTITGLNVSPGSYIDIRWSGNDVSGSGSRDEFGLDDINVTATFTAASTDHYRSIASGNWNSASTWETSPDNIIWSPATLPPTSLANTILIRNTHTVTLSSSQSADQLEIESGGILVNQVPASNSFTLNNNVSGDDMDIKSGGIYHVLSTQGYANYQTISGGATIRIRSGGVIRLGDGTIFGGSNNHLLAATSASYIWENGSIFEWNSQGSFTSSGISYFPDVNASTIPVFKTLVNIGNVGAAASTTFNGLFEANGNITFANSGTKIFRNGIKGSGNIDGQNGTTPSGKFIINGTTAELGGTGSLILPTVNGMEIGSASNTTSVSVTSNKTITGDISLLSTNNTFVDLGANNLTVTGTISGGAQNAYIRTNGAGVLTLSTVTSKTFPIGNSSYNPLIISNGNTADYSARVIDGINPVIAFPTYGINRTWNIYASVSTPGVNITFQYRGADAGINVSQPQNMEILINTDPVTPGPWSIIAGNIGIFPGGADPYTITTATPITIATSSQVHYALGKEGGWILPIDCIITTRAQKINNTGRINWTVNSCADVTSFEVQRSVNNGSFQTIGTTYPGIAETDFSFTDATLGSGRNLYRIKVNRLSGSLKYSNTVVIIHNSNDILISSLSPNPVHNIAKLVISTGRTSMVDFKVYNMSGMLVKQWQSSIAEGNNIIEMNLSGLPASMYNLFVANEVSNSVSRFVKQ